jgi:hypothetical protein
MKILISVLASILVILILIFFRFRLFNYQSQNTNHAPGDDKPKPSFTIQDQGSGASKFVFIPPEHYSKSSIENLCLWHHSKHVGGPRDISLTVFTDEHRMRLYIDEVNKPHGVPEIEFPEWLNPMTSRKIPSSRSVLYDAYCSRVPSEPLLEQGADPSSSGFNLTYWYTPDLSHPNTHKTVVLRGSTWTEGKHNIQTKDINGASGKVSISSYDLYNVEPPSRYYTFTYHIPRGRYEYPRIIFNIRLDKSVPLPVNQVVFLTDKILYVYLGWMFTMTTDVGKTWRLWDAEKDLPGWKCCDSGLIKEVNISKQGTGEMIIKPDPNDPGNYTHLHTDDFGQHWRKD